MEHSKKLIEPFVVGPVKTVNGFEFAVRRVFINKNAKRGFALKFKIVYEERNEKWHHFNLVGNQKDSLCKERQYAPSKDCTCIRACKKRQAEWETKAKAQRLNTGQRSG